MSYVEHGPRIFLAGKPSTGIPMIYGDYVLPKRRSEGRLKLHDSCSDVRAWSPNSLESSRYFRELTEHASPIGKIIPFNVVIENIIGLTSQAQHELQIVRKELHKYKSLQLTTEQEDQLMKYDKANYGDNQKIKDALRTNTIESLLKNTFLNISKSIPIMHTNSYFSINTSSTKDLNVGKHHLTGVEQNNQISFSSNTSDSNDKTKLAIKYADAASQIQRETCEIGTQADHIDEYILHRIKVASTVSQASLTCKSNDENSCVTGKDRVDLQGSSDKEQSFESDTPYSENSQDTETLSQSDGETEIESDFNISESPHKRIIIEKDSKIIELENELCVRDADLEELREFNKNLEALVVEKEKNLGAMKNKLKSFHEMLMQKDQQHNIKMEDLKEKVCTFKCFIEQLKEDVNKKCQICYLQSQEIEKLRLRVKDIATLQFENNSLSKRLKELEHLTKEMEKQTLASEQLRNALREKDELKQQNQEQSCILADQEDEISRLLILIKQMSVVHNQEVKNEAIMNDLRAEIQNKDMRIALYEEQCHSMKQEFNDFFSNLKNCLNSLEEYNGSYTDTCNCKNCEFDIGEEANNVLYNIHVIKMRFQSYIVERQDLLQQIRNMKHIIQSNKQICLQQANNLKNMSSDKELFYKLDFKQTNTGVNQSVINANETKNEIAPTFDKSESSVYETTSDFEIRDLQNNCVKHNLEIEERFRKTVQYSLNKMHSLIEKLEVYAEIERPVLIEEVHYLYETIKDAMLAVNHSEDETIRKKRLSKLYDEWKNKYKNCIPPFKDVPNNLRQIHIEICNFVETFLCQQLEEILREEKKNSYDKQINQTFEIYFKSCIDRMNAIIYGAEDQRLQIVEEIKKQQQEIRSKDVEIAQLKEEIVQYVTQRGEGDCLYQEYEEKNVAIKKELLNVIAERNEKNTLILELQEKLLQIEAELSASNKDNKMLKKEFNNLDNVKNRLLRECDVCKGELKVKNQEIANLSQQLHDSLKTKDLVSTMENKVKATEEKLNNIQNENDELNNKLLRANLIISKKSENIIDLSRNIDEKESAFTYQISQFNVMINEKHNELVKLKDENRLLNEKLIYTESKFAEMNATILSLTEENDRINMIYLLQENFAKLNKAEKKLKTELSNLKVQYSNDQSATKQLEHKLEVFQRDNESIQRDVEYWKNENSRLSIKIYDEIRDDNTRHNLYYLPNKIRERLSILKQQLEIQNDHTDRHLNERLQNERENANEMEKLKEQEQQLVGEQGLKKQFIEDNHLSFGEQYTSENNILKMEYRISCLENERKESEAEIKKLHYEIKIKNSEIKNLKESINNLLRENSDLQDILKSETIEYQDKLVLMKKNYDSSIHALCERHKQSVETLQKRFDDTITDERNLFDSENWLQSLDVKEIMKLHERICMHPSYVASNKVNKVKDEDQNIYLYDIEKDKEYTETKKFEDIQTSPNNLQDEGNKLTAALHHKEQIPNNILLPNVNEQSNLYSQNQWHLFETRQNQKVLNSLLNQKFNQKGNDGVTSEQRPTELKDGSVQGNQIAEKDVIKKQICSFISQCSKYHKMNNTF